jgi:hypothetical protein
MTAVATKLRSFAYSIARFEVFFPKKNQAATAIEITPEFDQGRRGLWLLQPHLAETPTWGELFSGEEQIEVRMFAREKLGDDPLPARVFRVRWQELFWLPLDLCAAEDAKEIALDRMLLLDATFELLKPPSKPLSADPLTVSDTSKN